MATQISAPDDKIIEYVTGLLKDAHDALKKDQLDKAYDLYKEALNEARSIETYLPDVEDKIRRELKIHSDECYTERVPSQWDLAQQTLELISTLNLEDSETRAWQHNLTLKQGHFLLEKGEHEKSFEIFKALISSAEQTPAIQGRLRTDIYQIVQDYMKQQAIQHHWPLLRQAAEGLKDISGKLQDWPETTSNIVIEIDQSRRRARNFAYILLSIFIVAALGYTCVLIQVLQGTK